MPQTISTKWQDLLTHPLATFQWYFPIYTDDGSVVALGSASARMVVREHLNDTVEVKTWTSPGGGLTLDTVNGYVVLGVAPNIQIPSPGGRFIYSLEVTLEDGSIIVPWQGRLVSERVAAQ